MTRCTNKFNCIECGKEFFSRWKDLRFCSKQCAGKARRLTFDRILSELVICEPSTLETGCWESPRVSSQGYARALFNKKQTFLYKMIYEHFCGPVPKGKELHHKCKNKKCCNFEHLEPLTPLEHKEADNHPYIAYRYKTHCIHGHPFTPENTYIVPKGRACRSCTRIHGRWRENYGMYIQVKLLPHQLQACAFTLNKRGVLNGMECGTGKTFYALAMVHIWRPTKTLIISPKSVCFQWQEAWERIWHAPRPLSFTLMNSQPVQERRTRIVALGITPQAWANILCVNYEVVSDLEDALRTYDPDVIIIDESSRVTNPNAKITQTVTRLCDKAKHVLLLNGTVFGNRGAGDLYSQLRMLGPDTVPEDYWNWVGKYCKIKKVNIGSREVLQPYGCSDPIGLINRFSANFFRVTKETCLQLPPKTFKVIELDMAPDQQYLYAAVEEQGEIPLGNPLSLSGQRVIDIRLQQIASGFKPIYDPFADEASGSGYTMEPLPDNPKLTWLYHFWEDNLKENPTARMIVWVHFNHEGRQIIQHLERSVFVSGETSNTQLEEICNDFNFRSDEGVQILVMQIKKGCQGLNLAAADYLVFYSNSWAHVERSQAQERSHRIGREGGIIIYDLIMKHTIDSEILDRLNDMQDFEGRLCRPTV